MSTHRRRPLLAALTTALAVVVTGCATATGATAAGGGAADDNAPPAGLERFYAQVVTWGPCATVPPGTPQECATVEVPIDYDAPDADTARLALARIPARGERIGSLVLNPGGPGFSGTTYLGAIAAPFANSPLTERFDLVGFDIRGVGLSEPRIDCFTDAQRDADVLSGGVELLDPQVRPAQACADSVGGTDQLGHFGTRPAARDLDVVRAALGDDQLSFAGISYGTRLGPVYAEMFPGRVRAMVLDGAIDPTLGTAERQLDQFAGVQRGFDTFAGFCAEQPGCPLGTDPEGATAAFHDLVRPLLDRPVPAAEGRELTYVQAVDALAASLYSSAQWPTLVAGLTELAAGRGEILQGLRDGLHERTPAGASTDMLEAAMVYNCLDEDRYSDREYADLTEELHRVAPVLDPGRELAKVANPCVDWPQDPTLGFPYATDVEDPPDTLTIAVTGDALTPYETGTRLAEILGGSLLTVEADQHGVLISANQCVQDVVSAYLVDLRSPADGTTCDG